MEIDQLIKLSVKHNASDLHLSAGTVPIFRIDGQLYQYGEKNLCAMKLFQWVCSTLTSEQIEQVKKAKEIDYLLEIEPGYRMRGNVFLQQRGIAVAFRHIAQVSPSLTEIMAPPLLSHLLQKKNGLILVTGATGSGKSTTLAAMIEEINNKQRKHIITIEDPIEFIYHNKKSLIHQREIGMHCHSFLSAMYAVLREDPDVILLGELRDVATVRLALMAAETGHLVLASLHTRSAVQTIDRLISLFPAEEKSFICQQISGCLGAVISQQLYKKKQKGRMAIFEILLNTQAVAHLIRDGKTHQLQSVIEMSGNSGMQTMEQAIVIGEEQGMLKKAECQESEDDTLKVISTGIY